MIDQALTFLRDELAAYVLARTNSNNVEVKLTRLVNEAGKYAFGEETIALSVIHLEEDRTFKSQLPEYTYVNGQNIRLEPELKINLHLLVAANFTVYAQAWKAISLVLAFFQSHPVFSSQEFPGLNPVHEKISVELAPLTYEQQNQIWGYIGGKYLPSVLYRIRIVIIQDDAISGISKPVTQIETDIRSK